MNDLRAAGFPSWWSAPLNPVVIQYVVVDWLYREVDQHIEEKLPEIKAIHGYRNIEVYGYIRDTSAERERRICLAVYGSAEPPQNIVWRGHPA